ncbi:glycoside hydrolase family 13 protein [Muricomes intestini]|jgi:oligo-1,6-glucosidase|uniref:Oligo-1,6-glucosidase n=1 Tax=Muricomes intestini TaxID=1796634 RepID=A0A4R3K339_9FIRM|nr:alpha-glucosidase [Muricomes intestini]TCS77101.1 oligo-1,6-glucosidase [Muricomes intestini]
MKKRWWLDKVAYQIYPKSFKDTNGDGIGDLRGIIEKLDYLKELGIDIIWISPVYQSPFVDQGYDISDYYKIAEQFGTMEDFDELLAEAKKRNMEIIMDLVINHTSDQHEWFQKALADPTGKYGDYYYFRKGVNGKVPSNYRSYFGGSTWEPVQGRDLYYLHAFAKEQPDLNWENPEVKKELFDMVNWWLDKGIAGFRIDAIINIKKHPELPSYEPDGDDGLADFTTMIADTEGVGELLEELKTNTFDKYGAFTVGEVFNMQEDKLREFIGDEGHFSTMFDFSGEVLTKGGHGWYDSPKHDFKKWRDMVFKTQLKAQGIGYYANIIENHDEPRGASRYLPEGLRNPKGIKMLACVNLFLRGIPFIYQGQEIGMQNFTAADISEFDDINTKDEYRRAIDAGLNKAQALAVCNERSRDHARTPMQWNNADNAGFTKGTPWLKVNKNYQEINVNREEKDPESVLNFYKEAIRLRKSEAYKEVFATGEIVPRFTEFDKVFAYERILENKHILIAANFGAEEVHLDQEWKEGTLLLSNSHFSNNRKEIKLSSGEAAIILL